MFRNVGHDATTQGGEPLRNGRAKTRRGQAPLTAERIGQVAMVEVAKVERHLRDVPRATRQALGRK